jgi:hypothetical protein
MHISYPLLRVVSVTVKQDSEGYTLSDIIHIIKTTYEFIYSEEERTATPTVYKLVKQCDKCITIPEFQPIEDECKENCCICDNNYASEKPVKLTCEHTYHNKCITDWFKVSNSCPLCRNPIIMCKECDNKYVIEYEYTCVVIPPELRQVSFLRNMSNGIFKIYGSDFEDLFLTKMEYNHDTRSLKILITTQYLDFQ